MTIEVSATELRAHIGKYIDSAAREPVFITKHDRVERVLLDIAEYERMKARDARDTDAMIDEIITKQRATLEYLADK